MLPLFENVNLQRSPNWLEFISDLDKAILVDGNKGFSVDCSTVEKSMVQSCDKLPADASRAEKAFPLTSKSFTICHRLLNLLCWIPDINTRSFSLYVTCIFNLERYIHLSAGCFHMVLFILCSFSCSNNFPISESRHQFFLLILLCQLNGTLSCFICTNKKIN